MFGIGPSWIGHNGLWVPFRILSCIGLLELMGWALVFGPSEERVKWNFTFRVGLQTRILVLGFGQIINWISFVGVSSGVF